jgi:hypothetical protein
MLAFAYCRTQCLPFTTLVGRQIRRPGCTFTTTNPLTPGTELFSPQYIATVLHSPHLYSIYDYCQSPHTISTFLFLFPSFSLTPTELIFSGSISSDLSSHNWSAKMKLIKAAQFFIAVCAALPGVKLDERENHVASRDISGSLATTVGLACTFLKQVLSTQTLFPGSANYTAESTGSCIPHTSRVHPR